MSARAVETTMPAVADLGEPVGPRPVCSFSAPTPKAGALTARPVSVPARPVSGEWDRAELEARLIAAHQRSAELEEQLAAAVAARDAAEHEAAQLEDRNRELASDLDNALDQLAGHALHEEQERLVRTSPWSLWAEVPTEREGYDR